MIHWREHLHIIRIVELIKSTSFVLNGYLTMYIQGKCILDLVHCDI